MPGQYSTIRDPKTGQLRKMEPSEAAQYMPIESPPPPDTSVTREDQAWLAKQKGDEPPPEVPDAPPEAPPPLPQGPPPLPPKPPPLPEPEPEEDGLGGVVSGAVTGAKVGSKAGPIGTAVGTAVGAAAGFLLGKSQKPQVVGSFEGQATQTDESGRDLRDLLTVTKQIAALGTPIKDAVTTKAVGSRM